MTTAIAPTTNSFPPPPWMADWQQQASGLSSDPRTFGRLQPAVQHQPSQVPDSRPTPAVYAPDRRPMPEMSAPDGGPVSPYDPSRPAPALFDQGRYWVGATLTAAIAALTGVIGLVVATGIFGVLIVLPGTATALSIGAYGLVVGAAALVAALLFDGMAHIAPHPTLYFRWLIGLLTALAAVVPFTAATSLTSQAILAGVNVLVGALILALVPLAASKSRSAA